MRLIMNFNRLAFEAFGFDSYDRAEIVDGDTDDQVVIFLSLADTVNTQGKAFAPCNEGRNATEGEKERYKIRWNEDEVDASGLIGSARYTVESALGDPSVLNLSLHSYIVAGQPESFNEPIASVSYTEVNGRTEEERQENFEKAVHAVLVGGDPTVIYNTLRMNIWGRHGEVKCWLKGCPEHAVVHIKPWREGETLVEQRELLLDEGNLILMRPDLASAFNYGAFTINDDGTLEFANGVDPVALGFSAKLIDMGRKPRLLSPYKELSEGMRHRLAWHRENVFRKP